MHWTKKLTAGIFLLCLLAYYWLDRPLPFPTPAQHDLVVLTTQGPFSYTDDGNGKTSGLEHDLAEAFARELGVATKFIVVPPDQMESRLQEGRYHLAIGWLSPSDNERMRMTPPIFHTRDVLAQHEASLPLSKPAQLAGKTVHVMAGSRQAVSLRRLAEQISGLQIVEIQEGTILDLLESLGDRQVEYVAMDKNLEDIANQYVPSLRTSLQLSDEHPIVWLLGPHPNNELAARAKTFIDTAQLDGTLARLEERYLGHVRRLTQADVTKFLGEIESTLPRLRKHFHTAEIETGIDWRLIAAVAYQESHWNPNATSYTNVRGIMMLTEETADRLGVNNRLDPAQSIPAGARYINTLKEYQAIEVPEPDRTWMALAAYNIGPGHFNAARTIARQLGADATAWYDMKRILPLLAKPKYYQRLKSGRARGGEAVILVENIRSYYDILLRNELPLHAASKHRESMIGLGDASPSLRIKH